MNIVRYGITGLLCEFESQVSEETNAKVAALCQAVRDANVKGITELVPAYCSLLVQYDPLQTSFEALEALLKGAAVDAEKAGEARQSRIVEIPVHYGGEYGPDLSFVAQHAGLTEAEVIRLHSSRDYRIYMIGFLPGFPYLGGLDERLYTPRLEVPRTRIPAGSVGIGGQQTGIYPLESPGGWQLIGRTELTLFDPARPPLYAAGDTIRFIPVG